MIQAYMRYLLRSWLFITICGFGFAALFLFYSINQPLKYKADLSFMINEDDGGSLGGLASMLGQFGLGMGGSESNLDKIMELSKTRAISQQALFQQEEINGATDYLANHYIATLEEAGKWSKKRFMGLGSSDDGLDLSAFRFTHDNFSTYTLKENKALKKLYKHMVGKDLQGGAFESAFSELSGIMNFSVTSSDASLSIATVNAYYSNLSDFYTEKTTQKQQADYKLIKSKYDSIQTQMRTVQYALAKFEDENQGLIRKRDLLKRKQLQGEEMKLGAMIGEIEKQFQIAQLSLENKTAYIQAIDKPIPPLKPANMSTVLMFLTGGFIGGVLSIIVLLLRKIFRDIMAGDDLA